MGLEKSCSSAMASSEVRVKSGPNLLDSVVESGAAAVLNGAAEAVVVDKGADGIAVVEVESVGGKAVVASWAADAAEEAAEEEDSESAAVEDGGRLVQTRSVSIAGVSTNDAGVDKDAEAGTLSERRVGAVIQQKRVRSRARNGSNRRTGPVSSKDRKSAADSS